MTIRPDSIRQRPLPYADCLQQRSPADIELVVIHATELPDLAMAREYGERIHYPGSGTGNSGHFYIDRDGSIEQWVPVDRVAHHVAGHNANSVGIELVNLGRYPHWLDSKHQRWQEQTTEAQIDALLMLLASLASDLPGLRWIAGHDQLDRREVSASDDASRLVFRKLDPGPEFPWTRVVAGSGLDRLPRKPQHREAGG
ncbi:MAG: N-acetylmuramoyl-L-alanine amidase [Wenzhouxiangella sp.]|nr:MAG: N-acetylmuramoyl-L-alanine amidase [Wenzhouxiangella sp.]